MAARGSTLGQAGLQGDRAPEQVLEEQGVQVPAHGVRMHLGGPEEDAIVAHEAEPVFVPLEEVRDGGRLIGQRRALAAGHGGSGSSLGWTSAWGMVHLR